MAVSIWLAMAACLAAMVQGRLIKTRSVSVSCIRDDECGASALLCDLELRVCKCRDRSTVLSTKVQTPTCLPARQLGEACLEDSQCRVLERNASCSEEKFCACDSGFYKLHDNNGTLCSPEPPTGGGETRTSAVDLQMIIILSVLAIMFVGICVALHLFSKARFRNRRTIFNSPHPRLMHIKLGRNRKKSSVHTHHLPPPPPHLVGRHHSFSGQPHSPLSPHRLVKVPKTRSHECLRSALSDENSPKFQHRPKTAPLATGESLPPSREDLLDSKTPSDHPHTPGVVLSEEEGRGSPTVIVTDAEGAHTVVTTSPPPASTSAVDV